MLPDGSIHHGAVAIGELAGACPVPRCGPRGVGWEAATPEGASRGEIAREVSRGRDASPIAAPAGAICKFAGPCPCRVVGRCWHCREAARSAVGIPCTRTPVHHAPTLTVCRRSSLGRTRDDRAVIVDGLALATISPAGIVLYVNADMTPRLSRVARKRLRSAFDMRRRRQAPRARPDGSAATDLVGLLEGRS